MQDTPHAPTTHTFYTPTLLHTFVCSHRPHGHVNNPYSTAWYNTLVVPHPFHYFHTSPSHLVSSTPSLMSLFIAPLTPQHSFTPFPSHPTNPLLTHFTPFPLTPLPLSPSPSLLSLLCFPPHPSPPPHLAALLRALSRSSQLTVLEGIIQNV